MRRFKDGVMRISPEQQLKTEISGYVGSIIGLCLAIFFLVWYGLWYISFAMAFTILIQVAQLIGKYQQYITMKTLASGDFDAINELIQKQGDDRK